MKYDTTYLRINYYNTTDYSGLLILELIVLIVRNLLRSTLAAVFKSSDKTKVNKITSL